MAAHPEWVEQDILSPHRNAPWYTHIADSDAGSASEEAGECMWRIMTQA